MQQRKLPGLIALLINIYGVRIELHSHMNTITFSYWLISFRIYSCSYVTGKVSVGTSHRNGEETEK